MKWSWKLGRFAGIDVFVHATFFLLIGWIALSHWLQARSVAAAAAGVAFILALFACVVLHEYGHALAARRFGIRTRDITLLPIGGLARLERMPEKPMQELWVALAGPAVNVVIALALFVWLLGTGGLEPLASLGVAGGSFAERLLVANVFLVLFNLLPAFPMDGGRVLRAILATRMEYTRATQTAAGVGQGMAFLFGLVGLFANPFLLFIALFVWIGAAQEASSAQMKHSLAGIPVARAMVTEFHTLEAGDPVSRAVELILRGSQQRLPGDLGRPRGGHPHQGGPAGGAGAARGVADGGRRDETGIPACRLARHAGERVTAPSGVQLPHDAGDAQRRTGGPDDDRQLGDSCDRSGAGRAPAGTSGGVTAASPAAAVAAWRHAPGGRVGGSGGMAERSKAAVLKTAVLERVPGVRIPLPPPERLISPACCCPLGPDADAPPRRDGAHRVT